MGGGKGGAGAGAKAGAPARNRRRTTARRPAAGGRGPEDGTGKAAPEGRALWPGPGVIRWIPATFREHDVRTVATPGWRTPVPPTPSAAIRPPSGICRKRALERPAVPRHEAERDEPERPPSPCRFPRGEEPGREPRTRGDPCTGTDLGYPGLTRPGRLLRLAGKRRAPVDARSTEARRQSVTSTTAGTYSAGGGGSWACWNPAAAGRVLACERRAPTRERTGGGHLATGGYGGGTRRTGATPCHAPRRSAV